MGEARRGSRCLLSRSHLVFWLPAPENVVSRNRIITDIWQDRDRLLSRCHGVIEMRRERFVSLRLRRWPKLVSLPELILWGERLQHRRQCGDRCLLYFNQPAAFPNFLALKYVVSNRGTTLKTFRGALVILDEIARLKGIDALLCDVANWRISRRLLHRWGWEPHRPSRWHRHYIKRFYGDWPNPFEARALCGRPGIADLTTPLPGTRISIDCPGVEAASMNQPV
jgi:hypothetical protein